MNSELKRRHGLAIDAEGGLLTYMTMKQPEGLEGFLVTKRVSHKLKP